MTAAAKQLIRRIARRARLRAGLGGEATPPTPGARSYSQQGEDMILLCLFQGHRPGFYVDIGAHHPTRFSNTQALYERGWRGINVDAMPGSMEPFRRLRPDDINIECGVGDSRGTLTYHEFDEPAVNGFSAELSDARDAEGHHRRVATREVPVVPLAELLDEHLPPGRSIDLLTVDAEGLDLAVLRSNDWTRYRPKVVVAEDGDAFFADDLGRSEVVRYLGPLGYRPCGKGVHSILLADASRVVCRPDRFFLDGGDR